MNEVAQTNPIEAILLYIRTHFDEYNFDLIKDQKYYGILIEEFPDLDLLEETKLFHIWVIDSSAKLGNPRLTFRKWLKNSSKWSTPPQLRGLAFSEKAIYLVYLYINYWRKYLGCFCVSMIIFLVKVFC